MQSEPNTPQVPFKIDVAERVKRLPPYLFGKINALKYAKRRAGIDVIDLGMGNPTDTPDPGIIDKLCETARADDKAHRYPMANGLPNLRSLRGSSLAVKPDHPRSHQDCLDDARASKRSTEMLSQ